MTTESQRNPRLLVDLREKLVGRKSNPADSTKFVIRAVTLEVDTPRGPDVLIEYEVPKSGKRYVFPFCVYMPQFGFRNVDDAISEILADIAEEVNERNRPGGPGN